MSVPTIVAAALWGAGTGLLVPRAAYRLAVEPSTPWRTACPSGHPLTGPARGWLGPPACAWCARRQPVGAGAGAGAAVSRGPGKVPDGAGGTDLGPGADMSAGGLGGSSGVGRADGCGPGPGTADGDSGLVTDGGDSGVPTTGRDGVRPGAALRPAPYMPAVATALVCGSLAAAVGARPELVVWLLLAPFGTLLSLVDRAVHRLPDTLTLPLAAGTPVLLGATASLPVAAGSWPTALLGGLALGGCYFLLFLINPGGMGFGDVKLALTLGQVLGWYGWPVLFAGTAVAFVVGAGWGLGLILLRRASRKAAFPFGPCMICGALAGVLYGGLG
ncbi:prepilin peptidase [Streptomyces atratus]|uniref:prepilin peptidase n=1 Tax=Streptomyces atratus TaxID=1893 RepID=UPI0037B3655A